MLALGLDERDREPRLDLEEVVGSQRLVAPVTARGRDYPTVGDRELLDDLIS